jgi:hypothetical protein
MLMLVAGSVVVVATAVFWRVASGWSSWEPTRVALAVGAAAVPLTLAAFLFLGPLNAGRGHASVAAPLQPTARSTATVRSVTLVLPARAAFVGAASVHTAATGTAVSVSGDAHTTGVMRLKIRFTVIGTRSAEGLMVRSGTLTIVPPDGAAAYRGLVTGISETGGVAAILTDGHGDRIDAGLDVTISPTGVISGDLGIQRPTVAARASASGDSE